MEIYRVLHGIVETDTSDIYLLQLDSLWGKQHHLAQCMNKPWHPRTWKV